ncbi:MAG: VTT domain-containing protein [Phycisphaeraceae bacterium]
MSRPDTRGIDVDRGWFAWLAALRSPRVAGWVKLGSLAVIVLSLFALARLLPVESVVQALAGWIEGAGIWGPIAFILLYVAFTVFMLPGSILTILAGVVFGLLWGTVTVSIGSTLGVAATFLIGRYLARDAVAKKVQNHPRFAAVDRAVGEGGWKIVALLRLTPVVPFNVQNYLYGLTAIRFWPCVLASWLAMLPGTFLYVYLGYAGRAGLEAAAGAGGAETQRGIGQWLLLAVGLVATVMVTIYVTKLARRAIRQQQGAAQEIENMQQQVPEKAETPKQANLLGTLVLAGLALVMLVTTACAYLNADRLRGMFGPPAVVMGEAYEAKPEGPTFDHSAFDAILKQHVNDNGGVDYDELIADPESLRAYNRSLADAPWGELGRDEKLALLINAYNSFTLQLMIEWLPHEGIDGIRDIPADQRWDDVRWNVGGHVWSLNQIEHEQIRPNFREPRIHWAVVCAAVGCPPLRAESYVAGRLDEQLAEQERIIHTDGSRWFRIDAAPGSAGVVHLSQLYNWYGSDFVQAAGSGGSVLAYVAEHVPAVREAMQRNQPLRIAYLHYDWSLNDQENLP